ARNLLALKIYIEPVHNVLQPLYPVPRLAGARELVRLLWKPHHYHGALHIFQGAEELLATAGGWRAIVRFALNQHQRRLDLVYVSDGRPGDVIRRILPRWRFEPAWLKKGKVR